VRDVVGLYINPPDHAVVLSVDEKSQIQALERTLRWTPDLRQVAMRESCSYKRPRKRSSHEAVSAEA